MVNEWSGAWRRVSHYVIPADEHFRPPLRRIHKSERNSFGKMALYSNADKDTTLLAMQRHKVKDNDRSTTQSCLELDLAHHERAGTAWVRLLLAAANLAWLAPVLVLLVLNGRSHVVGPSFGCVFQPCADNITAIVYHSERPALDHLKLVDRNVLGAMQLVSKALEIWFVFIACSLVYSLSIHIASAGSLPLQFLFLYDKAADPTAFFSKSLWAAPAATAASKKSKAALYLFLAFVFFLCALCNLIGPATAILLLPTYERAEIASLRPRQFVKFNSDQLAPRDLARRFSNRESLEHTFGNIFARETLYLYWSRMPVSVPFSTSQVWLPSLQTLVDLWKDREHYRQQLEGPDPDPGSVYLDASNPALAPAYANALNVAFDRRGPSIGLRSFCYSGYISVLFETRLAADRRVRCWFPKLTANGKYLHDPICVRLGEGWSGMRSQLSQFYVNGTGEDGSSATTTSISIYAAHNSVRLNKTTLPCILRPNASYPCDWDALSEQAHDSASQLVTEYTHLNQSFWCEAHGYIGFGNYSTMPSAFSKDSASFALDTSTPPAPDPMYVDPSWLLAAWSVSSGDTVPANDTTGRYLVQAVRAAAKLNNINDLIKLHYATVANAFYLITYDENYDVTAEPRLEAVATADVWKYGLASRTSVMGFTVVTICCIVALGNAVMVGVAAYTPKKGILAMCIKVLSELSATSKTDDGEAGLARIWVTATGNKTRRRHKRQSPARGRVGDQAAAPCNSPCGNSRSTACSEHPRSSAPK